MQASTSHAACSPQGLAEIDQRATPAAANTASHHRGKPSCAARRAGRSRLWCCMAGRMIIVVAIAVPALRDLP